jgi:hypothetical protein
MTTRPLVNSLRPECLAGDDHRCFSDYPVRLLTRRTLGQAAERILTARRHSPRQVGYDHHVLPSRRPPS